MRHILVSLIALSIILSGCFLIGQEEVNVTENVTPPPPPPPPPTPSFTIASPTQGEVLMVEEEGDDVTIVMSTTNLLLKSPGGAKKVGEGHFTVAVDDGSAETTSSKLHVLTGLELGDHTVVVELLHNDGTSYFPRLSQQVSFTIEQEEPDVYVPQTHTVTIKDFDYEPSSLTIKQTDSVTWVNEGSFPRSATCFIDGAEVFNTGVFGNGASATITFNDIMECEYYSTTHPVMKGTLIVVSNEG